MCQINNKSNMNIEELSPLIDDLASNIQRTMKIKSLPVVTLHDDPQNSEDLLGKTAYYDPGNRVITVYVTNRHPKDIMRSIAHEMIHHSQNENGQFDDIGAVGEGYAQADDHLRNMEKEAYLKGNMCFRDWEDGYKKLMMESIHRKNSFKRRNTTMKIHDWKNKELNRLLMEKFNLGEGEYNRSEEEEEEGEEKENLNEEGSDCVRDYIRMGYSREQAYKECEGMEEGKAKGKMTPAEKTKSDSNRPMGALKKDLKDSGMSDKEINKLSDDEIDRKAADVRLGTPQQKRNAKRMKAAKEKSDKLRADKKAIAKKTKTNESFRRKVRKVLESMIDSGTEAALNDPAVEGSAELEMLKRQEAEMRNSMQGIGQDPNHPLARAYEAIVLAIRELEG